MSIQIGNVRSIGKSENFAVTPDDRQELVQLVNGSVAVDGWAGTRQSGGDVVGLTAMFTAADANTVIGLWNNRTKTSVTLENGDTIAQARVVVKRISYPDALNFRRKYTILDLEFWKV